MKAIILAAGMAQRLRPLTENTPKCLLKIGERTLLGRTIDALLENEINELVVVTGFLREQIEVFIKQNYPGIKVTFIHNADYATTNNIYSLWLSCKEATNNDILLLDSDILFDPKIITTLLKSEHPTCLAVNKHELGEEEIKVIVDPNQRIWEISKTCSPQLAMGESIGIERMSAHYTSTLFTLLDKMINDENMVNVFYEAAFERTIEQGEDFYAIDTTTFFSMELDTVDDFNDAINKIPENLK